MNRKLIRPDFGDLVTKAPGPPRRRTAPPDDTHAESHYYLRQMAARTPMVVVLTDGEELRGVIEWYDRGSLKLNRNGKPNLLLLKHAIKYMYKDSLAAHASDRR